MGMAMEQSTRFCANLKRRAIWRFLIREIARDTATLQGGATEPSSPT